MQIDVVSTFAQRVLPALLAVPPQPGAAGQAQALLKGWDGAMTMDAPQPLIFNAWIAPILCPGAAAGTASRWPTAGPLPDFVAFVRVAWPARPLVRRRLQRRRWPRR